MLLLHTKNKKNSLAKTISNNNALTAQVRANTIQSFSTVNPTKRINEPTSNSRW
jgi:hypothetical protein